MKRRHLLIAVAAILVMFAFAACSEWEFRLKGMRFPVQGESAYSG